VTAWKTEKILRQLEEKHAFSETEHSKLVDKNTGEILIIPSPDDPHKNIVAEHDNYWQIKNGEVSSTKIILSTNP